MKPSHANSNTRNAGKKPKIAVRINTTSTASMAQIAKWRALWARLLLSKEMDNG